MQPGDRSGLDLALAALAGVASVALVIGTLAVEQIRVTHEVQVWAPAEIDGDGGVPVRARVLADLESAEGPRVVVPRVLVARPEEDPGAAGEDLALAGLDTFQGECESDGALSVRALGPSSSKVLSSAATAACLDCVIEATASCRRCALRSNWRAV